MPAEDAATAGMHSLPVEIKQMIVEDYDFGPLDLFSLSRVDQTFRSIAGEDGLYERWTSDLYRYNPDLGRSTLSRRALVVLSLRRRCCDCNRRMAGLLYVPAMKKLCAHCMAANDAYRTIPVHVAEWIYSFKEDDCDLIIMTTRVSHPKNGRRFDAAVMLEADAQSIAREKHGEVVLAEMRRALESILAREGPDESSKRVVNKANLPPKLQPDIGKEFPVRFPSPKLVEEIRFFFDRDMEYKVRWNSIAHLGWLNVYESGRTSVWPRSVCPICRRWRKLCHENGKRISTSEDSGKELPRWAYVTDLRYGSDEEEEHLTDHAIRDSAMHCDELSCPNAWLPGKRRLVVASPRVCATCLHRRAVRDHRDNPDALEQEDTSYEDGGHEDLPKEEPDTHLQ
ncbi:hypothetical protein PUNSTDRAFT_145901 [Punctularia strigosozonata HHB-11173 SS5]|uniref:uncharacterized protein n=1 Tax=Punctularia strigosozonata (strain HHB-11173) TaxID=741275 RepID=UPI000441867B|nr:uncharacterized protein PUNSTDRAFT_145901 [Punctularia strigosozonata HHB-11173 SS5]EIN05478.1 hypothetical protein PUNSTDRAFT_145901 [Punctularia strigosozonata HHB-11173 SS5]